MTLELDILDPLEIGIDPILESVLKQSICAVLEDEGITKDCEISLSITDNKHIKALNTQYRQKEIETDVLSFPQYDFLGGEIPKDPVLYLGDIVISVEKAAEQAKEFDHSFNREMVYLTVHSMYHLLGYDHMNEEDKKLMREKEKRTLKKLGVFKKIEE